MIDTPAEHAGPRRTRRASLRAVAAIAAIAAIVGIGVVIVVVLASRRAHPRPSAATSRASATTAGSTGPSTGDPAPALGSIRAPTSTAAHQSVAAAAPTEFSLRGPKFLIKAHVCGMDNVRPLDPPGEQHHTVCWVQQGFGVAPGSRSATTYVLGHAWAQDRSEVLNKLSEVATAQILAGHPRNVSGVPTYPVTGLNGYALTLRTATGILRYTVRNAYGVAKSRAADVAPLMNQQTRNRVVIITCAELAGTDYDYNVVVNAYLTSSIATQP